MAILAECPICHRKQSAKNRLCSCGEDLIQLKRSKKVKLLAHRAVLPGHAVASRMRANEISFFIVPLDPAYKVGLAVYLPAKYWIS